MTRDEAIEMLNKWGVLLPSEASEAIDMAIEALSESVADDTTRLGREYIAQDIQNKKGFIIGHHCREDIVRCKDCKHRFYDEPNEAYMCDRHEYGESFGDDDFCSYAERREP